MVSMAMEVFSERSDENEASVGTVGGGNVAPMM